MASQTGALPADESDEGLSNIGLIVGASCGAAAALILAIVIVVVVKKRKGASLIIFTL